MIKKLGISGIHTKLNADITKYVIKKIAGLDKYLPRHARASAHGEVKLKEESIKAKKLYTCEVILQLPGETIMTKESTINMFAAVDIVEAKLKNQLKKYKEKHTRLKIHRRLISRFRMQF